MLPCTPSPSPGWLAAPAGSSPVTAGCPSAIRANAWALDGPGRVNTVTVEQTGLIAKLGAEGVLVLASPDGTAAAVKMLDGSSRATTLVGLELFVRAGLLEREAADRVLEATLETVFGGGQPVGGIRVAF